MNFSDDQLKRLVEAMERMAPPPPPRTGLHRHDVTEKAISIRNTSKGKSLCQWTSTEDPIPVAEVNAITGRFLSLKWNVKPKTEKDGTVSYPEYLMVHVEASPTEVIVVRSNLKSNWSFQLLMALESLPREALKDQLTILLLPNDMEKYDPAVFCRLYHKGNEVKYLYKKELKEDSAYLAQLVESFDAYLNPAPEESAEAEIPFEAMNTVPDVQLVQPPKPVKAQATTPPVQSATVEDQIRVELKRLNFMTTRLEQGKSLLQENFGAGVTTKSLTPEQLIEWLNILKQQEVEPESVPEATPQVVEAVDHTPSTPEPIMIPMESMDAEKFLRLTTEITVKEKLLGLSATELVNIRKSTFGKTSKSTLSEAEMTQYLEVLNQLGLTQ